MKKKSKSYGFSPCEQEQSCIKSLSWYPENQDIFKKLLLVLAYLGWKRYNNVYSWHNSTLNDYKWTESKPMFTFMPQIVTKFTKYMIQTFFCWESGYRTKIIFLQLWTRTLFQDIFNFFFYMVSTWVNIYTRC